MLFSSLVVFLKMYYLIMLRPLSLNVMLIKMVNIAGMLNYLIVLRNITSEHVFVSHIVRKQKVK
ncbi:hypothetical protein BAR51_24280 (plasmid) [Salmonella enterica subsp. enterica serovar Infantis]|nr:hypothetical protein BAR51_24280 [Salmonella enterica subsp. enterica serovar Infantis]APS05611.1 hypothetical protein ATD18_24315 [Salmonella enterica subsp. enterica serovar Infantis]APS10289.1 hypothetical protein BBV18_24325 [Salmonella enterica subsp. enterica serovar Infantis]APS14963.1 hypothetical protein APL92_24280 [Salmonella enterica subsp. enterica serovar Infantis]KTM60450.1 hypothetical protein IN32_23965 [Salmonella enterica]